MNNDQRTRMSGTAAANREAGLRRISAVTAALALAGVVGTGLVVKEAQTLTAAHAAVTSQSADSESSSSSDSGLQAPASAPTVQQAPPVTVSSGS